MLQALRWLWRDERGQGMTEYGLIIGLVAIAVIAVLVLMGDSLGATFQSIVDALPGGGG